MNEGSPSRGSRLVGAFVVTLLAFLVLLGYAYFASSGRSGLGRYLGQPEPDWVGIKNAASAQDFDWDSPQNAGFAQTYRIARTRAAELLRYSTEPTPVWEHCLDRPYLKPQEILDDPLMNAVNQGLVNAGYKDNLQLQSRVLLDELEVLGAGMGATAEFVKYPGQPGNVAVLRFEPISRKGVQICAVALP